MIYEENEKVRGFKCYVRLILFLFRTHLFHCIFVRKNIVFVYNKQLLTRVKHQHFRRCFIGIGIAKNLEENPEVETSFPVWNLSTPHEAMTCIKANMMDIVLYIVLSCNRLSDFSKGKGHFCRCSRQLIMYSWSSVCGVC